MAIANELGAPGQRSRAKHRLEVSGWIDPQYRHEGKQTVLENGDLLDYIMPANLRCTADGGITIKEALDEETLAFCRENAVEIMPLIGGDPDDVCQILADASITRQHIDHLLALCLKNDWAGIDIDYEFLPEGQKEVFTNFVRETVEAFHAQGKLISVDLHPKVRHDDPWSIGARAQDWTSLGGIADILRVMCYDQCHPAYVYPDAGPISAVAWANAVMTHAAGVIPKEKLIMGLPFYGCDWNVTDLTKTKHLYHGEICQLSQDVGANPVLDELSQCPQFRYVDSEGQNHHVWFENGESFARKVEIADRLGVRGISIWVFIKEDPQCWSSLRTRLRNA